MGAAAAAVLLRRAIRRAFHAVCNLLVLHVRLILMLQDQLQGRNVGLYGDRTYTRPGGLARGRA